MPTVQVTLHPRGLHPIAAARAWHLSREEGMPIRDVCAEVVNMSGNTPSVKAVWRAIRSVDAIQGTGAIPSTKYAFGVYMMHFRIEVCESFRLFARALNNF